MPADPNDIDQLLRGAMKTLDDEVPAGYFDRLPQRTLARLEDGTMQTSTDSGSEKPETAPPPVTAQERDDSGLHDIRSLAQSTKMRLSQNMAATRAPTNDEDLLATSSAGWKSVVALPEPAKMVSLPEISELPSKKDIKKAEKAAKAAEAVAVTPATAATAAPAKARPVAAVTPIGSRIAAKQGSGKGKIIAIAGVGLAAAAGITLFVMSNNKDGGETKQAPTKPSAVAIATPPVAAPTDHAAAMPPPPEPAPETAKLDEEKAQDNPALGAAAGSGAGIVTTPSMKPQSKSIGKAGAKKESGDTTVTKDAGKDTKVDPKAKKEDKKPGEQDPNFDDLLNEAGVDKTKKVVAPKLDKKSLSSSDIKTGMNAVSAAAAACYAGTQGTASIRLTVTPDGKVKSVTVTGVFANTPVANCVAAAVRGATFPPWDGGPQSFGYSYLLQEK